MIGSRLGPYEITAKLGEGGMGEVYRATDTKLHRDVAIKVLPAAFTEDQERLQRFEREAQLLAQLQHPNIASIYGLEESGSTRALVMELVDGPTLADRLETGSLSIEESLSIARQIAEALEEAHEKGIVHRDLKPQNIKAPIEGKVKVLDFGLAKAMDPVGAASGAPSGSQLAASPTLTLGATQMGVILGTAAYMSPEQAKGLPVDKRADVWAFGVVLWEMLVGGTLFAGDTVGDTLAAVIRKDVDLDRLPEGTPPALRRLLRRCLERSPKNRLHSIADARIVIDEILGGRVEETAGPIEAGPVSRRRELVAWGAAALLAAACVALLLTRSSAPPASPRVIRATLPLPPGVTIELDGERAGMPELSPDGTRIAVGARHGASPMEIWVVELATGKARALPGTEGGYRPFWSPDGSQIGYFTWGHLNRTPAAGGAVSPLAPARDSRGGTWNPNGTIVYSPHPYGPLLRIPEGGGTPEPATSLASERVDATHRFPKFLPDGERFVYLERFVTFKGDPRNRSEALEETTAIRLGRLGSLDPVATLSLGASNGVIASDHLLFVKDGALIARPLTDGGEALGARSTTLVDDLLFNRRFTYGVFSADESGLLAFLTGEQRDLSQLVWRDREGRHLGELGEPGRISGYGGLALSSDGRWASGAYVEGGSSDTDLRIFDLRRGTETRLSREGWDEYDPVFSPDGRYLYFGEDNNAEGAVVRLDLDAGSETVLHRRTVEEARPGPMSISPDGSTLLLDLRGAQLETDEALLNLADGETRPLFATEAEELNGQISPDGRWLAWSSDSSGRYEVYVQPFPDGGSRIQVSRDGGTQPRWNPKGGELFFKDQHNVLTAMTLEPSAGTLSVGSPRPMFPIVEFYGWTYAVAPDGERFLVRETLAEQDASPITILTDWPSLLPKG